MNKKIVGVTLSVFIVSLVLMSVVSAAQIRPMNQVNHPGINNRYHPGSDGPNHVGVTDYSNVWTGWSQLCEGDKQYRPANQGLNIPRFFSCLC